MRFSVRKDGKFFKIWDDALKCFYRISGNEVQYKTERKAKYRCGLCNNKWMPDMKQIELLVAWDDNTWSTTIEDCPDIVDREDSVAVTTWINEYLIPQTRFRKAVLITVYNIQPELDTDDPRLTCFDDADYA